MKYLKLTNIPLNLMNTSRYGGNGKNVPWVACGFNILMVRSRSVQVYIPKENPEFVGHEDVFHFLPITNDLRAAEVLELIKEDILPFPEMGAEILDLNHSDLVDQREAQNALKIAAQPVE